MGEEAGNAARIRTQDLVKIYGKRKVVDGVSVEVQQGEVVGLLGPNGAGKTTTFQMIVGFLRPNSGTVFFNGQDVTHLPMFVRARLGIGYLPQETSVFRKLTVEENIKAILELRGFPKPQQKEITEKLLEEFGIAPLRKQLGQDLSGGERRRVEIARALATQPQFMLLDEPFTGIDPIAVEEIQKIIARLREQNIGVLITDHNVRDTLEITDRAYIIYQGQILTHGPASELPNDPVARQFYFGERF